MEKICSVEGCATAKYARGMCRSHYRASLAQGKQCTVEGCEKPLLARGWCSAHHTRWTRHGDPLGGGADRIWSNEERFAHNTERKGECLIWTGIINAGGYGRIYVDGEMTMAHRYAWERAHGPIPVGLFVDHQFHCSRSCVEVSHLRLATKAENGQNRSGASPNNVSTGIRNVYPNHRGFQVKVSRKYFGTYPTIEEATEVAERARLELFGEYAGRSKAA